MSNIEIAVKRSKKKSISFVTTVEIKILGGHSSQQFWVSLPELAYLREKYPDKWKT